MSDGLKQTNKKNKPQNINKYVKLIHCLTWKFIRVSYEVDLAITFVYVC